MKHSISLDTLAPCLNHQQLARQWVQSVLGIQLPVSTNLQMCLRDGVHLCKLMEQIKLAKTVDIHYGNTRESWTRNIQTFLLAAGEAGLSKQQLFSVADLLEGEDMDAVANTLMVLHSRSTVTMTQTALQRSRSEAFIDYYYSYDLPSKRRRRRFTVPIRQGGGYAKPTFALNIDNRSHAVAMETFAHDGEKGRNDIKEQSYYQCHDTTTSTWLKTSVSNDLYTPSTVLVDNFVDHHQHVPPPSKSSAFESTSSNDSDYPKSQRTSSSEFSSGTTTHIDSLFEPSPSTSPATTDILPDTTENTEAPRSRLSRFSSLSFAKRLPTRQKIPFHMRYQEWADLKLRKRRSLLISDNESNNTDTSDPVSPSSSNSSPLVYSKTSNTKFKKQQQRHQDGREEGVLTQPPMDPTSSCRANELGVPRRKSTGTLSAREYRSAGAEAKDKGERLELRHTNGTILARYKLGNQIGKGQFGTVHRALNLKTGQMVAIKRIKLESTRDRDIDDVMQEAELLQTLSHPNIVRYEGFIRSPNYVSIVLEFVENGSLSNTLRAFGSFPENLVASYCARILEGLAYLHEKNVVHCDLKAANILTTKTGDVKLSDFGVSVNLQLKETVTGSLAGTPNWMAPEVIQLQGASTKSDIWSLGCTIIELFTGKPPYSDLIPMTTLFRIVEDDCPPLPSSASPELLNFLRLCLKKNPDDRPTAEELLTHSWIKQSESSMPPPSSASEPSSTVRLKTVSKPISSSFPRSFHYSPLNEPDSDTETEQVAFVHRGSILVNKLQERQRSRPPLPQREHCFVKGSFAKAAIRCKACHLPIKRNALVCEDCGFICHDKCRSNASFCRSTLDKCPVTPTASVSSSSSTLPSGGNGADNGGRNSPRPTPSMSSQLRERTKKLSRVFTGSISSNNSTHHHYKQPHSTRSHETLRFIREGEVLSSGDMNDVSKPLPSPSSASKSRSTISSESGTFEGEIRNSTSASYVEHKGIVRSLKHKHSRSRPSNPDECIIS